MQYEKKAERKICRANMKHLHIVIVDHKTRNEWTNVPTNDVQPTYIGSTSTIYSTSFIFGMLLIWPFCNSLLVCFFFNSEAMQMHKHKHKYFDWFRVHGTNSNQRLCENFCIKFTYLFVRHYDDSLAFDTDNEKPIVCQLHSMNGQAIIPES